MSRHNSESICLCKRCLSEAGDLKPASTARIKQAVLAYRDGVLESTSTELTREDAEQVRMALNLNGFNAAIDDILANARPYRP